MKKYFLGIFLAAFGLAMTANSFADPSFTYIKNNVDGSQTLTGHVPLEVKNSTAAFKYHANLNINAQIIMPLRDQAQLSSLLQDMYDPKSPDFHHFLTPAQFDQQFAVSVIDSTQVQEFLKKEGISVTGQSPNGAVLYAAGPSAAFEKAFGLHINNYQKSDGTLFFAPDADPTIPATLAGKILAVGGLDNFPKYRAHRQQYPMNALPKAAGTGPGGFLAPNDVKTAYNLNSVPSTGSGQSVALFELDGYSGSDITAYESHFGLSSVPLQNVLIDGFNGVPNFGSNGGADEVTLDIELVAAFAPGSSNIYVYEASNTTQSWIDEWTKIASDDKAKVISCSWGEPELDSPTLSFDNTIFQEMAAQGQAVFVAAGDNGAYDNGSTLSVDEPSSQPYATAVGISKLTTNSGGAYSSETASVYGGGGVSVVWPIPSYQVTMAAQAVAAAKVSTTMRNMPDVVLTADASTAYAFYIDGSWWGYYGSSLSSPIWASFISRVNQGLGQNGPIGSVNSALYQLAQTSSYANDFHDITTGNNGYYPAEPGFDDATGLGSFNGLNLYNDLVKTLATTPPSAPTGLSAAVANVQVSLSWTASSGASSYDVGRSTVNGGPYTTIASSVLNTTYTDNSVANNTTYYYVVSAVNSGGQSANSSQISATPSGVPVVNLSANNTSFTAPANIILTATASEINGTISSVKFYNGVTLLATLTNSPYVFTWSSVPAGSYSFTAVATDGNGVTDTANTVTVTVAVQTEMITASAGSGGTITPSGAVSVNYGASQIFTVTPNAGYNGSLKVDGVSVTLSNNTYTLSNVTTSHTVVASFTLQTETLTVSAGSNGKINPSGVLVVYYGISPTFYLTPNAGYTASLTVDGVPVTLTNDAYSLLNVTASHTLIASFSARAQTNPIITVSAGSGGTISPSGSVSVISGASQTFTLTPNAGYAASLTVDGVPVTLTNNTYTLSNVTTSHTVVASFALETTKTLTVSAGSGGTISPSGVLVVNYGISPTFYLTPNAGYTASLTVDGLPVTLTNNAFTLWDVTASHTLIASFASQANPVITASAGSGGTISPSGSVRVISGASQTFTLTPNAGYAPSLTVDGVPVTLTNNTYTLNNVTTSHTVVASFTLETTKTLTVSAGSNGTISPSGVLVVNYGISPTFYLTPNAGYTASLTVDGVPVTLINNAYSLLNVTASHTLVASFTAQT